ncbi:hypothetical protein ACNQS2_11390, partial [Corynebacterium diphtheriae]
GMGTLTEVFLQGQRGGGLAAAAYAHNDKCVVIYYPFRLSDDGEQQCGQGKADECDEGLVDRPGFQRV